jgi:REP element-mobilizing transposase RayT
MDRLLDYGRTGPRHLARPEIAWIVAEALRYGQDVLRHYDLHAFVVMSNHVHVLLTPRIAVPKLLGSLKSITAKRANQILGLAGKPFWQEESYDRLVRDGAEFDRIRRYIEENQVRAGLVAQAADYRWSSAWDGQPARGPAAAGGGRPTAQ